MEFYMNIGIIGAGGIAVLMAKTLSGMKDVCKKGIAARDLKRAQEFAGTYGFEKAYGSYEDMLADPDIELVYVAIPHSHHHEWTIKALEAGKHVLCEKAFATSCKQAKDMVGKAKEKNRLLAEAIWTRYMPSRSIIDDIIASGTLGEITGISANLGYKIDMNERIVNPALAGGALLDLGVYTLNFASMVMGDDIKELRGFCQMTDTGVDGQDNIFITYNNGVAANLYATIYSLTDRSGWVYGRDGYLEVMNINNPSAIRVWAPDRNNPRVVKTYEVPKQITGYEYEVMACIKAIEEGKIECPEMPHSQTLEIMRQVDDIRSQYGVKYPFD